MPEPREGNSLLAFDYGLRHIGVATGQRLILSSNPLAVVRARDGVPDWPAVEKILRDWTPDLVLVGLPLNMDGTDSPMAARARKFARQLNGRFNLPCELVDERLSSFEAKQQRRDNERQHQRRHSDFGRDTVDADAACIILQSYYRQSATQPSATKPSAPPETRSVTTDPETDI